VSWSTVITSGVVAIVVCIVTNFVQIQIGRSRLRTTILASALDLAKKEIELQIAAAKASGATITLKPPIEYVHFYFQELSKMEKDPQTYKLPTPAGTLGGD
jgi:hypothetical protein